MPEYASYLLASLGDLVEAPRDAVIECMRERMTGRLRPDDFALLYGGRIPRWMNQADHMLDGLIEEGFVYEEGSKLKLTRKGHAYLNFSEPL